ncbi:MAG: PD-(D/E)XK nuclease family protein [Candidatus Omnitrophica bacterium]|nr:PD-(D/E)XK nuclease family protein [Candidatus Omnitrophota bacterium]
MKRIFTVDFTQSFIDELAAHTEREFVAKGRPLDKLAVVFGGKRPSLFLKRELARRIGKGFVSPRFFTIDEFMDHVANRTQRLLPGRELDRSYVLYRLAQKVTPGLLKGREGFAQFLPWAREILDFIEQLDLENVDNKDLLSIQENAAIGYAVPESINDLLKNIRLLREAFHAELKDSGQTFRGLQYLRACGEVRRHSWEEFDDILFCNLFYFHRTEEEVVRYLYDKGKATLIFQGDQRKWPVLERIARRFGCELLEGATPTPAEFKLHVHAAMDVHSEAAIVKEILVKTADLTKTVVVLPNAENIVPLLSELPADIPDVNISMGYRLRRSSLYFLLDFLMRAQLSRKGARYYTKDYLAVLRHPFLKNVQLAGDGSALRVLVHKVEEVLTGRMKSAISGSSFLALDEIMQENAIFESSAEASAGAGAPASAAELKAALATIHQVAFTDWEKVRDLKGFAGCLGRFLDVIVEKSFLRNFPLNINIASRMYDVKDEFADAAFSQEPFAFDEIFRIFEDKLARELVHFSGTPLKGLQVLGLFETRSLNFDNVIIMDANEGILPKLDIRASLVPREVMMSLKLDRLELEEEIQRYQFMRIISSAKNVHLIYQDRPDQERSRFIEELAWEEEKKAGCRRELPVERAGFNVRINHARREVIKTPAMIDFLRAFRYSSSSVNRYLNNPYEFYTNHVLGLKEAEDLLDEPDGRLIGTFLHGLLKEAYAPLLRRPFVIDDAFAKRLTDLCAERFAETFLKSMRSDAFLLKAVIDHRLKVFLEKERDSEPRVQEILYLEQSFEAAISLAAGPIRFHCVVDRVDRLKDGTILLMDYKTGGGDLLPRKDFGAEEDLSRKALFKDLRSFQIPLYYYFLSREFPQEHISAEIYNLREAKRDSFSRGISASHDEVLKPYLKALDHVIFEIMDPNVPFVDDPIKRYE